MELQYMRQLTPALRALVDEIETSAGSEITVRLVGGVPKPLCGEINLGDPVRMTLISAQDISETLPPCYPKPFAAFCHELLHLRRIFIERVPSVFQIEGMAYGPTENHPVFTLEALRVFSAVGLDMM